MKSPKAVKSVHFRAHSLQEPILNPLIVQPSFSLTTSSNHSLNDHTHTIPISPTSKTNKYLLWVIRNLQQQKRNLLQKLQNQTDLFKKEQSKLQVTINTQSKKIDSLSMQNEKLKIQLRQHYKQSNRPTSCIRSSSRAPKQNRVIFSDNLEEVIHIQTEDCPSAIQAQLFEDNKVDFAQTQISRQPLRETQSSIQEKRALLSSLNFKESSKSFSEYYLEQSRRWTRKFIGVN